ncbi:hypothetical protein PAXRUDRAFT_16410 [Paxillus rubicundulus Ve08.2h10]|uniref:Uncharacterized protein n=1 Tax=Paxillus rubicundulus Ve08.2h10 TaxID=930991 RepID=A0A0D0C8M8_9AGAM|nr:hypothetical protein PAXRUDRAFT_16410 [Paxillus rubicundulus Ve08.2h10]
MDLVDKLVKTFTWVPPLAAESDESKESLSGPEAITDEELTEAFDAIDHEKVEAHQAEVMRTVDPDLELDGNEVLEGKVCDWKELEVVNKGTMPMGFVEDISMLDKAAGGQWNGKDLLSSEGVTLVP